MRIRVLLADDHLIVLEGIKTLLNKDPDIEVVDTASNGREAIKKAEELRPDVIIMDIGMPELNGIDATTQIKKISPSIKIVVLSMHSDKVFISKAFKAGVSAFLIKECDFEEIIKAIKTVYDNQTYISPLVANILIEDYRDAMNGITDGVKTGDLTVREREILQLIAEGLTSKEMATKLNVSSKTIDTHRQQIMDKLNIRTIAGLTRYAIKQGIIS